MFYDDCFSLRKHVHNNSQSGNAFLIITKLLCGATFKYNRFVRERRCESTRRIKPFSTLEQCISFPNKFIVPSVSTLLQNVNEKGVIFSVYSSRQIIAGSCRDGCNRVKGRYSYSLWNFFVRSKRLQFLSRLNAR